MEGDYRDFLIGFLYGKLTKYVRQHIEHYNQYDRESKLTPEQRQENESYAEIETAMRPYFQQVYPPQPETDRRKNND